MPPPDTRQVLTPLRPAKEVAPLACRDTLTGRRAFFNDAQLQLRGRVAATGGTGDYLDTGSVFVADMHVPKAQARPFNGHAKLAVRDKKVLQLHKYHCGSAPEPRWPSR